MRGSSPSHAFRLVAAISSMNLEVLLDMMVQRTHQLIDGTQSGRGDDLQTNLKEIQGMRWDGEGEGEEGSGEGTS